MLIRAHAENLQTVRRFWMINVVNILLAELKRQKSCGSITS